MSFEERIHILEQRVSKVDLAVLVWGPGSGGGEHYEKRVKIREDIRTSFPNARVAFSEELIAQGLPSHAGSLTAPEAEEWHLAACDVCVVLDTAKGSGEEIAHFCNSPDAHKLLVLTSEQYQDARSFPADIRRRLTQFFYTDEEYVSCSMVAEIVAHVRQVAFTKLRREARW